MYLELEQLEIFMQMVEDADTIIIHRHLRPDPDALGSQLGLKLMIKEAHPQKRVLAAGTTSKGLAWMGEMDKVNLSDYHGALVIVTDTANQPRIEGQYYYEGENLVKIDHHPEIDRYGNLEIVHTEASSASEIVALMSHELESRLPMTKQAAALLYAGIIGDTGRFMYDSTTKTTFETVAWLSDFGVDFFEINDRFITMTREQAKFQGYALDKLVIDDSGFAYLTIPIEVRESFGLSEEETNSVVNLASSIEGVYAWTTFVEQTPADGSWRCRIRSKGPIINTIAEKYNGGGHPKASGATVYSIQEKEAMIEDLKELCQSYKEKVE